MKIGVAFWKLYTQNHEKFEKAKKLFTKYSPNFNLNCYMFPCRDTTIRWEGVIHALFYKLKKLPSFWLPMSSISRLKCYFKNVLKKTDNFLLVGLSFMYCTWNNYRSFFIPRNLPCPEKYVYITVVTYFFTYIVIKRNWLLVHKTLIS